MLRSDKVNLGRRLVLRSDQVKLAHQNNNNIGIGDHGAYKCKLNRKIKIQKYKKFKIRYTNHNATVNINDSFSNYVLTSCTCPSLVHLNNIAKHYALTYFIHHCFIQH